MTTANAKTTLIKSAAADAQRLINSFNLADRGLVCVNHAASGEFDAVDDGGEVVELVEVYTIDGEPLLYIKTRNDAFGRFDHYEFAVA